LGTAGIASLSQAAETARPVQAVDPIQLDRAIDQILSGSDFDWRLRPLPAKEQEGEAGAVKTFVREAIKQLQRVRRWIGQTWEDLRSWMRRLFPDSGAVETPKSTAAAGSIVETLVWIFLILLGLAFAAVLVLAWKRRQPARPQLLRARAIRAAAPDLQDESTHASQLPMEGWLALAREQMSRGEWRLAWRALFLASLARLSAQGLIALAKFKTNLDYEREVRRRGAGQTELVSWFSHRRDAFESVWYGRAGVIETEAREWLTELEKPLAP
jgi:hypothetical protein